MTTPPRHVGHDDTIVRSRLMLPPAAVSRRAFLAGAAGLTLVGCSSTSRRSLLGEAFGEPIATAGPDHDSTPIAPTTTVPGSVTSTTVPTTLAPTDRVLVVVSLDGGNDAVNTLAPDLGSYRDLRPGLALPESDLLRHAAIAGHGLHPSLAPVVPYLELDQDHASSGDVAMALVAGVGFPDPDRSHFTSIDRWDRADRMDEPYGWLGRWLDTLPGAAPDSGADGLPVLAATALGSTGRMLLGAHSSPSAIGDVDAFAFPTGVSHADIRALAAADELDDPLRRAARAAFAASVGAVEEFDAIADAVRSSGRVGDDPLADEPANSSGPFANGLAVAAELIASDAGARVVTVRSNGFDTHSAQLETHAGLLGDLAAGLAEFWAAVTASGDADRVLVMTTSEFGRRVAENGSAGCDHGAGGLSLVMGPAVEPGLVGAIDTDELVDGDLAPAIDTRSLYTAALDWLGADVETVLGRRWDDLGLLRG